MEDYRVTQTGDEIQEILNQSPIDTADIVELKEAATSLDGRLESVEVKIPAGASEDNPLTDKQYVDDSIASASATFRGTYNEVTDLELTTDATHADIGSALDEVIELADSNDYCFVQIPTDDETPTEIESIERYKFVTGTGWEYEYTLNNSGFTADQWSAINSGITRGLVTKLADLPTNAELETLLNGKANAADVYTKSETYNKTELDAQLGAKANSADVYEKSQTYTKHEVDALITTPEVQYVTVTATSGTTSVTDVLPATGAPNTIYRVGSWDGMQYATGVYSEYAWNGITYILLDVKNYGFATGSDFNNPTTAQRELVTTVGSVLDGISEGVFDLTAKTGDSYATLADALTAANTSIPTNKKKGGMSIKYVQTSDNKYVQYRLMANEWSIDTDDWTIAEEGVYVENHEFIYVKTDAENKILWAIKTDGNIYYGAGVPQQVVEYIQQIIEELSLEDIVAFLDGLESGDKTLQELFNEKVDKETGKGLVDAEFARGISYIKNSEFAEVHIDTEDKILYGVKQNGDFYFGAGIPSQVQEKLNNKANIIDLAEVATNKVDKITGKGLIDTNFASSKSVIENPEFLEIKTDSEDRILEAITVEGRKQVNTPIDTPSASFDVIRNPEWLQITTDNEGRVLEGIKRDGSKYINKIDGLNEQIKEQIDESVSEAIAGVEQEISMVKDVVEYDERELVPDYYFANDYLDNKVDFIRNLMEGCMANGDAFFFQTDEHWELNAKHSPALIKYIADRLNISRLFDGGDSTHEIANYRLPHLNPAIIDFNRLRYKTYNGKIIHAVGNHEYLTAGYTNEHQFDGIDFNNWIDTAYFNNRDYDGAKFGDSKKHYYYIDNEQKKIRYIVLAAFKQKSTPIIGGDTKYYSIAEIDYDNEQLSWFTNSALNVEAGWTILVFTHFFWTLGRGNVDNEGYIENISPYISASIKPYGRAMLQYEGNGEIAAVFMGHEHTDGVYTIDDASVDLSGEGSTGKSIPCICTTCDAYNFELWPALKLYNRTIDTITEQAFDVVILDKTQKKFTLVRIGAPAYDVLTPAPNGKYPQFGDLEYREISY